MAADLFDYIELAFLFKDLSSLSVALGKHYDAEVLIDPVFELRVDLVCLGPLVKSQQQGQEDHTEISKGVGNEDRPSDFLNWDLEVNNSQEAEQKLDGNHDERSCQEDGASPDVDGVQVLAHSYEDHHTHQVI